MSVEKPVQVFFAYSRQDEALCKELQNHLTPLERQGIISPWYDRKIVPGKDWEEEISQNLNTAQVILLLISSDFIASKYCYDNEMKRAVARHEAQEAVVIPIILRPVYWQSAPFGKLQALPKDGKPVTTWTNLDEAFYDIAQGIRRLINNLIQEQPKTEIEPPPQTITPTIPEKKIE